ncbi:nicotinate-nucleotide adenylyltransferase [Clostridium perfringens]|nr:nicotinate-nucleotide adenylyltransferase [Clostridium perfringens]
MKKIGVIGGTFDPIHIGHIYIAYEAYKELELDEVIFMPAGNPPHKRNKDITDEIIRYEMVKKAINPYSFFSISNYEIEKQGLSFTYETLRYLNESFGEVELYFITGADCLVNLNSWKNISDIFKFSNLVVFNRPGFNKNDLLKRKKEFEKEYCTNIVYLDLLNIEISSTFIRERVANSLEVKFFLPPGVMDIINKNNLYRRK